MNKEYEILAEKAALDDLILEFYEKFSPRDDENGGNRRMFRHGPGRIKQCTSQAT